MNADKIKIKINDLEKRNLDLRYVVKNDGYLDIVTSYGLDQYDDPINYPHLLVDGGKVVFTDIKFAGNSIWERGRCSKEELENLKKELTENIKKLEVLKMRLAKKEKSTDKLVKKTNVLFERIRRMFISKKMLNASEIEKNEEKTTYKEEKANFSEELGGLVNERIHIEKMDKELEELKGLEIGSQLHEDWRKTRLNEDGTYEPRWKKVKDENFDFDESSTCRKNEDGTIEIDIANRSFSELSSDWQYENLEAGKIVAQMVGDKTELTDEERDEMASKIHDEWLKRNDWVFDENYGNPAQAVPFADLSEEEKDKDREQLKFGLELNTRLADGSITKKQLKEKFSNEKERESIWLDNNKNQTLQKYTL